MKKENCQPLTCQLPDLKKATDQLCVTDFRKKKFWKTCMVVDILLRDPLKPERKASVIPGKVISGLHFSVK